jgi:hypothetical protein
LRHKEPTRLSAAIFSLKAAGLRGKRFVLDQKSPGRRLGAGQKKDYPNLLAEFRSPLWAAESRVENSLQQGKVQNLRRACFRLNHVLVPKGEVFSFWKQIGKATRSAGFVEGRELREGCLIPSIGGGLCQLSNALYELALRSDCEIVERHAHTSVVPGSAAEQGRDATVFWNYVDFRFRPRQDLLITSVLSRNELVLNFWGRSAFQMLATPELAVQRSAYSPDTCTDCNEQNCFRHRRPSLIQTEIEPASAFLIEECWPEFQDFVGSQRLPQDELFLPFRSRWLNQPRYQWTQNGFARITAATVPTLVSSLQTRLGKHRGAAPVEIQVHRSNELAEFYGRRLHPSITHLYIAQSLLPGLWKRGDLGGRSFSVLISRLPLAVMHKKLDELSARYPERTTFKEYRAPAWMVEAEQEALQQAEKIVTPHSLLSGLYPNKTEKLPWNLMPAQRPNEKRRRPASPLVVFGGPALARKGAFELREALREVTCRVSTLGKALEFPGFWNGLDIVPAGDDWMDAATLLVQPAFIENNPRPLLRAISAGIPVIATLECGLMDLPNLTIVPAGDVQALRNALTKSLASAIYPAP